MDIVTSVGNASFDDVIRLLAALGDRKRDFIRCYNTSSVWCHKYACLVLRGLSRNTNSPREHHHIVPIAYYRTIGLQCDRHDRQVCRNNLTKLSQKEHILAHFYMALCCNMQLKTKHIRAFYLMYYGYSRGNVLYNEHKRAGILLDFKVVTESVVLTHLNSTAYPIRAKSNSSRFREGRAYKKGVKYPLVPYYYLNFNLKTLTCPCKLHDYPIALIYNKGYAWFREALDVYIRYIRTLAMERALKQNVRFNDYVLRQIPRVYAKRFMSINIHKRVWAGNLYDTIEQLDTHLKLATGQLFDSASLDFSVVPLNSEKPAVPGTPETIKPKKPLDSKSLNKSRQLHLPFGRFYPKGEIYRRYKCRAKDMAVFDEPIVLLHGCDL